MFASVEPPEVAKQALMAAGAKSNKTAA